MKKIWFSFFVFKFIEIIQFLNLLSIDHIILPMSIFVHQIAKALDLST